MSIRPPRTPHAAGAAAAPRPRARRAATTLALVGGLVAAGALAVPAAASAAPASAADASLVVPAAEGDGGAAIGHWTAERRAAALATDPAAAPSSAADPQSASAAGRLSLRSVPDDDGALSPGQVSHADLPSVGVLFYVAGGRDRACTAGVVATADGDAIATAAHCLYDRDARTATTLATFIPGAQGATAPHGIWPVRVAAVSTAWTASGNPADDAGFARVRGPVGPTLAASVGAAVPVFGSALVPPAGLAPRLSVLGYPAAGSPTAVLEACAGRPHHDAGAQVALPCALEKGSAGSPVVTAAGEQRAVVARPSAGRGVLLATWGADAEQALASLQAR